MEEIKNCDVLILQEKLDNLTKRLLKKCDILTNLYVKVILFENTLLMNKDKFFIEDKQLAFRVTGFEKTINNFVIRIKNMGVFSIQSVEILNAYISDNEVIIVTKDYDSEIRIVRVFFELENKFDKVISSDFNSLYTKDCNVKNV